MVLGWVGDVFLEMYLFRFLFRISTLKEYVYQFDLHHGFQVQEYRYL